MTIDKDKIIAQLRAQIDVLLTKLHLAQAYAAILDRAYDALLHYGINFKSLRTWSMWEKFSEHHDEPVEGDTDKRPKLYEWLTRVGRDLDAAVLRRKNLKPVK